MRRHNLIAFATAGLVLSGFTAPASPALRLTRWSRPAELAPSYAPGIEYYRLMARLGRERGAAIEGAFAMHVVLPDGRTETRSIRQQEIESGWLTVLVPSAAVRNLRPAAVVVRATVVEAATGKAVSNVLTATIADFPHPAPEGGATDPGPFGWGEPRRAGAATDAPRLLPRPGPDGLRFVRVPASEAVPAFFVAIQEATNAQVAKRLSGYDPKAGRSDEFALEDPAQPALGLSPNQAEQYLAELGKADPSGVTYRLPQQAEWLRAARAGKELAFWWGDEATYPAGANFLGPEPALANDSTAPALTEDAARGFAANPWGLFHTFGNVAEWASTPAGGFLRLGGHFRTEPASPLPEVPVEKPDTPGPDPYVGVRPAFDLSAESGAELIRKALKGNALLADLGVAYDPEPGTATLTGTLSEPRLRRSADRRLETLWFLAAVENRIVTPQLAPGQLATLGAVAGAVRRITPLGRWVYEVPVSVRWADPLPVRGSEWWVNIYLAGGGHFAHKLVEIEPSAGGRVIVLVERARLAAAGLPANAPVSIALSLGAEAPRPTDPQVVSNVVPLRWGLP